MALSAHVPGVGLCGAAGTSRPNSLTRSRTNRAVQDVDVPSQPRAPAPATAPVATKRRLLILIATFRPAPDYRLRRVRRGRSVRPIVHDSDVGPRDRQEAAGTNGSMKTRDLMAIGIPPGAVRRRGEADSPESADARGSTATALADLKRVAADPSAFVGHDALRAVRRASRRSAGRIDRWRRAAYGRRAVSHLGRAPRARRGAAAEERVQAAGRGVGAR